LVVSHDRDFLDRTVTEVLAFEGDTKVEGYMGGYSDYHAAKKKLQAPPPKKSSQKNAAPASVAEVIELAPKLKLSGKEKHELEKLPAKIAALEAEIATLKETLLDVDLYTSDPDRFDAATRRFAKAQHELETCESRWLELEELRLQAEAK
jgi:ATP-binding cassette subfamily F protein uup